MEKYFSKAREYLKCKTKTVVCILLVVAIVVTALPIALITFADDDTADVDLICTDDFDRADSDTVGNGWVDADKNGCIKDNQLKMLTDNTNYGAAKMITRPTSEDGVNQSVSVRVNMDDMHNGSRFALWLRAHNVGKENVSGYLLIWDGNGSGAGSNFVIFKKTSTSNEYTVIAKQMMNMNFSNGGWDKDLVMTFSAEGSGTTSFKFSMLNTGSNWKPEYEIGSDNTPELQKAGVVGISSYNIYKDAVDSVMGYDDFSYSCTDLSYEREVLSDTFDRDDSANVGNGWGITSADADFKIASNTLVASVVKSGSEAYRLQRPQSEASVNQSISISVDAQQMIDKKFPTLWLRLQENADSERAVGYYTTFDGSYIYIGKTSSGGNKNKTTELLTKWFQPDLSSYNGISIEFSASATSDGKTTLTANYFCDLKTGTDWSRMETVVDDTPELQSAGTVAISGHCSSANAELTLDNFAYTAVTDLVPLVNLISSIEADLQVNKYYSSSVKEIEKALDDARTVILKRRKVTQSDIDSATKKINDVLANAIENPTVNSIKINGIAAELISYNTYFLTVANTTQTLNFSVDTKAGNTVEVARTVDNAKGINNQAFEDQNCEEYTVTVKSREGGVTVFYVSVYREGGEFSGFEDKFERNNGSVGRGWIESVSNSTLLIDKSLTVSVPDGSEKDDLYTNRVMRPSNEKALDQIMTVDIPVEDFQNGLVTYYWLRSQEGFDGDPINGTGYFVKIALKGNIEVYKRNSVSGGIIDTLVGKAWYEPKLTAYEGDFRFEIMIKGTDTTNIRVRVRNTAAGGTTAWRFSQTFTDTDNPIKSAGTVGVSGNTSIAPMHIKYFSYKNYVQPVYMLHCAGTKDNAMIGQWLDVSPNETYVLTYRNSAENDLAAGSVMPMLKYSTPADADSRIFYFTTTNNDFENKTFTGEFKVPSNAIKHIDGNVSVWVGINGGCVGADAYQYGFTVYRKGDISKTNLLENSDFKKGFYGWNKSGLYPILDENLIQTDNGEIVLEEYDANIFAHKGEKRENDYDSVTGDFMWYSNGVYAWSDFVQKVDVKPGETYIFSYYYNFLLNNWIQPQIKGEMWDEDMETHSYGSIPFLYKKTDSKNCIITCELKVPSRIVLNPDGETATVDFIINSGNQGSQAYFYKPMFYLASDANKTNLLHNADFRRGLEGWRCRNGQIVSIPGIYNAPGYGDIELVPVDYAFFNMGDIAGDGEWWREFYPNGLPDGIKEKDSSNQNDTYFGLTDDDGDFTITDDDLTDVADDTDNNKTVKKIKKTKNVVESESKSFFRDYWIVIVCSATALVLAAVVLAIIIIKKKKK